MGLITTITETITGYSELENKKNYGKKNNF